jgi:hypothetical protein
VNLQGIAREAEIFGPISLDLNAAEGDQGLKTKCAKPGGTVSAQIFVKNAPAISGYSIRLEFDSAMLKLGTFTSSDFIPNKLSLMPTQRSPDIVDVGDANLSGATRSGSGLLGTVTFQATEKFRQETQVVASRVVFNQPAGIQEIIQRFIITLTDKLPCPDFNGDGFVAFDDFFLFARAFGTSNPEFDLNCDEFVDFEDFFIFANTFGKSIKC